MSFRLAICHLLPMFFISSFVAANDIPIPQLGNGSNYAEYWEQQFYFDTQTLLTSQFLIVNLSLSKHHGLMVATLKHYDGDQIVIKNGRKKSGWNFKNNPQTLNIFQHYLARDSSGFSLQLDNTAAEVDMRFTSLLTSINITEPNNADDLPAVTLYAPMASGNGRWRAGPEIGGTGKNGEWLTLGNAVGYGLHVRQTQKLADNLRKWHRITGLEIAGAYQPVFHQFVKPDGKSKTVLFLLNSHGPPIKFDNVNTVYDAGRNLWRVSAANSEWTLTGQVRVLEVLEVFNIEDHMNGIEKLIAGSLKNVKRSRAIASYHLTLSNVKTNENSNQITGKALFESIDIGEAKKPKRRRHR